MSTLEINYKLLSKSLTGTLLEAKRPYKNRIKLFDAFIKYLLICLTFYFLNSNAVAKSIWDLNGSEMLLNADGNKRFFSYLKPRNGLDVQRGTTFFEGTRKGNEYAGWIYLSSEQCGTRDFRALGRVTENDTSVVISGNAPILNQNCEVVSYSVKTFTLKFIRRASQADLETGTQKTRRKVDQELQQAGEEQLRLWAEYKNRPKTLLEEVVNYTTEFDENGSPSSFWISGSNNRDKCIMKRVGGGQAQGLMGIIGEGILTSEGFPPITEFDIRDFNPDSFEIDQIFLKNGGKIWYAGDEKLKIPQSLYPTNLNPNYSRLQRAWALAMQECPPRLRKRF
jgi:hypothetical protein